MPPGQRGLLAEALDRGPAGAHHRPRPIPPYAHFPFRSNTHTHTARTRACSLGSLGALVQLQPVGKVIANAAKRRRCQKTAAAQGEPPKKRRRTKAASRQPPPPGPTASAPTSPASAAGRLQFRPIMPAPDLRAFQPLPGALWPPLGPPPPSVAQAQAQAQAHADPTQSPVPSCGGTSSPAPSPSHVDSCVDMSPISIELESFSNGGLSNSPEAAETCANASPEGTCCCVFSVSAL
jgi:hypothetical protein